MPPPHIEKGVDVSHFQGEIGAEPELSIASDPLICRKPPNLKKTITFYDRSRMKLSTMLLDLECFQYI
jgi:hypothetical protein